ncbi:type II secretion system F family protein [Fodinibius salsisoli]|uniref:Type II secretion system F family protein n=1 Tax=Fodinibius salsisoli TaxID=2820877 RepID=A0ABT3PLJ4_9BACT|nr:type II secretion system F family protein [Fodinibius salsisoli]MCW9706807.1 type II secretion system F family protein [Fodinibius salsisoli]
MARFRFKGRTNNNKLVQAEFDSPSKREAKQKVNKLARAKSINVSTVEKKSLYKFKVQRNGSAVIQGEQEAFNKEELSKALSKLGYKVLSVKKKLFQFKGLVSSSEVVTFIRLSADLLRQELPYSEILTLLYEDTTNKRLKEVIRQIQKDLQDGKEGYEVYGKHEDIFGKFGAHMLGIASTSGNMAEVFESTAKFMERDSAFKKSLRRALMMPSIALVAVMGVILFYVGYIFPLMAEMFLKYDIVLPPMTAATLEMSYFMQDHWLAITLIFTVPIVAFLYYIQTNKGRYMLDKYIIRIPVIGDLLHKMSIEIFARVFYTLYSDSGQNVEVIKTASEACRNVYMERQIKDIAIKKMLMDGTGLVDALTASGVFTRPALSRFKLGAESGSVRENAEQLADYYEVQTEYKLAATVEMITVFVNIIIAIALTAITIVSSEAALIQPNIEV